MPVAALTEAAFHAFMERLDAFTTRLTPRERHFLTMILASACAGQTAQLSHGGGYPGSAVHTHLAYALWEATQDAETMILPNPIPTALDAGIVRPPRLCAPGRSAPPSLDPPDERRMQ